MQVANAYARLKRLISAEMSVVSVTVMPPVTDAVALLMPIAGVNNGV